jgi:hypothetical protein
MAMAVERKLSPLADAAASGSDTPRSIGLAGDAGSGDSLSTGLSDYDMLLGAEQGMHAEREAIGWY